MKYLYIDTSSNYLYSGIMVNGKLVGEIKEKLDQNLSKDTLPLIAQMLENAQIKPKEINKIIVVNGPGSFTGIRIGITIAKVYANSLNIDITTISSLQAMATSIEGKILIPVIDARRGYVYSGIYDSNIQNIMPDKYMKLEELKKEMEKFANYKIITNNSFEDLDNIENYIPDIEKIILKFKDKKSINPHNVNPCYLKRTEAEEKLEAI